ncbi:MAG: hypothetical protein IH892_22995 [Planctomycetes bacterium]|nr:hypothetical protein [Planctomycetota bacterium]
MDGFEDPANGSLVGGAAGLPETSITHGGKQSLPFDYDNTGAGLSEATRTFDPAQDWTIGSPTTLAVHFYGALGNSGGGQVYVKINNVKVTYDANPAAISSPLWTQWNIDLSGVGMVNSLTIGVEGAGAQGVLYVDDMILYRQAPAPVVAQDPGTDNLVAYYALDNNAQDGSGNGHNGTLEGSPVWVSPGWDGTGACMQFGPQDARITVESFDVTGSGITLAAWINPSLFTNDARIMSKSQGGGTADHYWAMVLSGGGEDNLQFRLRTDVGATTSHTSSGSPLQTDEWTHIAVTWDAADPTMRLFKNSQEISSVSKAGTAVGTGAGVKIGIGNQSISALAAGPGNEIRPFEGLVDEVRVYSRGLSVAELIHVAFGVVQK